MNGIACATADMMEEFAACCIESEGKRVKRKSSNATDPVEAFVAEADDEGFDLEIYEEGDGRVRLTCVDPDGSELWCTQLQYPDEAIAEARERIREHALCLYGEG